MPEKLGNLLSLMKNPVEHTLGMYADDFALFPACGLYDEKIMDAMHPIVKRCHIYFIGEVPKVEMKKIWYQDRMLCFEVEVGQVKQSFTTQIPDGQTSCQDQENGAYIQGPSGEKYSISEEVINNEIYRQIGPLEFKMLYIGQAYGKNGKRNAVDRLKEHGTLQKIAVKGVGERKEIQIISIGLKDSTTVFTMMNPWAKDQSDAKAADNTSNSLDTLFNTSEMERVSIYEAAMIRYFQPEYNKQLKNNFPSTQLQILQGCYDRDMQAVVAEFGIENLPYNLCSDIIVAQDHHKAH